MNIEAETLVGEIATRYPLATRTLSRHGIDFCCGGGKPLSEACAGRGLEVQAIIDEIHRELYTNDEPRKNWEDAPLADLIDHILVTYHEPLYEELPRLEAMARKVAEVHGDKAPAVLPELASVVTELRAELEQHMAKEEQVLFPLVRQDKGYMAEGPIACMEHEHEIAGAALRRLRELTNCYEVPEGACNTWRALWYGLMALEIALHEHIHLENNILFPRALMSEPAVS